MNKTKNEIVFLSGLACFFLLLSPAGSTAQEETQGVAVTKNLSITGGMSHETTHDGLPAYADLRFNQGLGTPGVQEEISYRSGLTYHNQEGTGIFFDINRSYQLTPYARGAAEGDGGTQLRAAGGKINIGFFTRILRRAQFFFDFGYAFASQRFETDNGERLTIPKVTGSFGVRMPVTRRTQFNLVGAMLGNRNPGGIEQGITGMISSRISFDTVFSMRTPGGIAANVGVANIFDQHDNDTLRKSNGLRYNPGRNFFISFKKQF